jgi:hypothetical protein
MTRLAGSSTTTVKYHCHIATIDKPTVDTLCAETPTLATDNIGTRRKQSGTPRDHQQIQHLGRPDLKAQTAASDTVF